MHAGICSSNPNNAMAQLAMGMLCVVYTAVVTPFSSEWEYVTPWYHYIFHSNFMCITKGAESSSPIGLHSASIEGLCKRKARGHKVS